jgi:molecular chaperone GrpE
MKDKHPNSDDVDLDDSVVAEENAGELIKKLRDKLKTCEAEKQQYLSGWQRAKADLINARRQDEKDKGEFVKFANEMLIHEVLPVFESFEMATVDQTKWQSVDKNWREGIERIFSQLKKVLEKHGIKEIDPTGERYDHNYTKR